VHEPLQICPALILDEPKFFFYLPGYRYYPGVDISDDISTESARVGFLQSVAQIMLTKARMKLNIKKLYSADVVAVRELLKVASLLYKATERAANEDEVPSCYICNH
jgi:hypothetical protein